MILVRLCYYHTQRELELRECSVSDDGESKSSKLARLSFILLTLIRKDEWWSEAEELLNAKYLLEGLDDVYYSSRESAC